MTARPTPARPFPAICADTPITDNVPRWTVQRFPAVGSDALSLIAFDGEGYPFIAVTLKCNGSVELFERVLKREVEAAQAKDESRPSRPPLLPIVSAPLQLVP